MSEEEEKGFVIKDRRRLKEEDESAGKDEPKARVEQKPEPEPQKTARAEPAGQTQAGQTGPLPEVTFSTFVFSLSTSALLHLGEIPDPNTNQINKNLSLAKQTIDILGMLQEKTKGNLEDDEANLLQNLLYELRMKYVTATK